MSDREDCCGKQIECDAPYKVQTILKSNTPCVEIKYHLEMEHLEPYMAIQTVLWAAIAVVHWLLGVYVKQYIINADPIDLQMKLDRMRHHLEEMRTWDD